MSERGHSLVLSSFGRPRTTGPNFLSSGYVDPLDAEELQSVAGSGITEDATDSSAGDSADSTGMSLDMFRERSQGFDVRILMGSSPASVSQANRYTLSGIGHRQQESPFVGNCSHDQEVRKATRHPVLLHLPLGQCYTRIAAKHDRAYGWLRLLAWR